jgi:hypothetical protein
VLFFEISKCSVAIIQTCHSTAATINLLNLANRCVTHWLLINVIPCLLSIQCRVFKNFFLGILLKCLFDTLTHIVVGNVVTTGAHC